MKKNALRSLLSIFLAVFMVVSLAAVPANAAGINKSSITLTKGYQTTLQFSGSSSVTWSTGDKSIATVTSGGKVAGKAPGTTYVYAKSGGKTYKCKVNVVPSKITASKSTVEIDEKGQTATITMTIKGSHTNLSVSSTDKSVATASWVKPWNGDKIGLKITAKNEGSCRIKVYNKNYSSTCYKYIDVNVGSSLYEDDDDLVISASSRNLSVEPGKSSNLSIYCSNPSQLAYASYNSTIASVTAGNASGNYINFNINGVMVGTTTVRFYDKNNVRNYIDVNVSVGGNVQYYEFYSAKPSTTLAYGDMIKQIQVGNSTYYVLVPANYDPANLNSRMGDKFGYQYYMVYDKIPTRIAAGDTYKEFIHSNTSYAYGKRYILLPSKYDEVIYNTAVAVYNNIYEYYKVYSEKPVLKSSWDGIEEWTVKDSSGKDVKRYVMYSWTDDDYREKLDKLKEADKATNSSYSYYVLYDKQPAYNTATEKCEKIYTPTPKYMIVPKTDYNIVKMNDAIKKVTGVYEKYTWYSSKPSSLAAGETYIPRPYGTDKTAYMLVNAGDSDYTTKYNEAMAQALTDKT